MYKNFNENQYRGPRLARNWRKNTRNALTHWRRKRERERRFSERIDTGIYFILTRKIHETRQFSASGACVCFARLSRPDHFYTSSVYDGLLPLSLSLSLCFSREVNYLRLPPVPEWTLVIGPKILWQLPSFKR